MWRLFLLAKHKYHLTRGESFGVRKIIHFPCGNPSEPNQTIYTLVLGPPEFPSQETRAALREESRAPRLGLDGQQSWTPAQCQDLCAARSRRSPARAVLRGPRLGTVFGVEFMCVNAASPVRICPSSF